MGRTWQERARHCLREQRRTQADLAESLGCSRGTVSHYLSGRRQPKLSQLESIARELRVSPGWLAFAEAERDVLREPKTSVYAGLPVPLARAAQSRSIRGLAPLRRIPKGLPAPGRHAYLLEVRAEIYAPRLRRGEFAVFHTRLEVCPGDEVLAPCAEGQDWELCELRRRRGRPSSLWLVSVENGESRLLEPGLVMHPLLVVYCRIPPPIVRT